ncbi:hypothetical protein J2809_004196 [Arthrobacter pascens]|uniref:hypothetical protein n=1 Tax=Arthrobacter pascens TaxID=1677 RepID=UPI00285C0CD7|nr:hypothetical protein [Arthrobacter pascens]MDR6559813.1 hypothetical protein [Arthrobacter pascens]
MYKKALAVLTATAVSALVGSTVTAAPAQAFSDHKDITSKGLSFLHWPVVDDINDEHAWMDSGAPWFPVAHDEKHFDDCEFDGSATYIRDHYDGARAAMIRRNLFNVGDHFGALLHTSQDFYSHSNWVELGFPKTSDNPATSGIETSQSDLSDITGAQRTALSSWPVLQNGQTVRGNILLANDDWIPPLDQRVVRNGAGKFQSILVQPNGKLIGRLLETGRGGSDHECSIPFRNYAGFTHDQLAKDDPGSTTESRLKHRKARALAELQTGYEWCRLVSEAGKADRDGMLLAMWVRPGASPHPPNTPCGPVRDVGVRTHPVTITVESVQIINDGDPGADGSGEIQLATALYDDPQNFRKSVHRQNRLGRMSLNPGDFVPKAQLPQPMTICARHNSQVNFALHAWDNDDHPWDKYATVYDDFDDDDEMLTGGRIKVHSEQSPGSNLVTWQDLRVKYRVSQQSAGATCN